MEDKIFVTGSTALENKFRDSITRLREQLGRIILGKTEVIENVTIALLSGGHILMEDVPGGWAERAEAGDLEARRVLPLHC